MTITGRSVPSATAVKCITGRLRRLGVVRRDDEESVRARLLGVLGELDALGGVVGADAGDQLRRARPPHRAPHRRPRALGRLGRRRLTGRTCQDQAVDALVGEVHAQLCRLVQVE